MYEFYSTCMSSSCKKGRKHIRSQVYSVVIIRLGVQCLILYGTYILLFEVPCSTLYFFGLGLIFCLCEDCSGIFKQSMGARNRKGIALAYRPARLHRLAESIPWNRFLGSLKLPFVRDRVSHLLGHTHRLHSILFLLNMKAV